MASKAKNHPEKQDDSVKSEVARRFKMHPFLFAGTVLVLVIVIVAFVFVPAIVPNVQAGVDMTFGYYNKVPIRYVLNNYFYNAQQNLTQQQEPAADDPNYMLAVAQIWQRAFEETAVHTGMLDEMKQSGFIVSNDKVDREMAALPQFLEENGRFSAAKYRALDNSTRMNLWQQVKENVIAGTYLADSMNLNTPSKEISFVSSMASPRRTFDAIIFPLSSYPQSETANYIAANPDSFKMIRLSQITVASEREARQILDSVKSGATTFEEAARANSQDWAADRGGDMGAFMTHELEWVIGNDEAREAVINMAAGEFTEVYQGQSGWTFLRVDEAAYPADPADPSQQLKIQSYIMQNLRGPVEDWAVAEAEKFSARAAETNFEQALSEGGWLRTNFGPIPLNYGDSVLFATVRSAGVGALENAGTNEAFWKAAFSTPLNSLSAPLVIGENVVLLRPLEETSVETEESGYLEAFYPYMVQAGTQSAVSSYFLNSEKLDNRFQETFWKLWGSGSN